MPTYQFEGVKCTHQFNLFESLKDHEKHEEQCPKCGRSNTANITFHKINDIVSTKDSILEYIKKDERKFRDPEGLIELLFSQPFTKVKHLVDSGIYAENTAREYLNRLSDLKVLEKKEISGHHYYLNLELYRILSE